MKVYKSYFGRVRSIPQDLLPVSIARVNPKWWVGSAFSAIAPSSELLSEWKNGKLNQTSFRCKYYTQLEAYGTAENILKELETITGGKDCVLLCFEKPEDFCHRHILADWMSAHGIEIPEWQPTNS